MAFPPHPPAFPPAIEKSSGGNGVENPSHLARAEVEISAIKNGWDNGDLNKNRWD